ncbi:MAG: BtrH N-terminal domain-containing protein, partial [Bradymonadaceae bacterium]
MAVDGFEHRAGTHCGSVAMRDVLAWAGIDLSEPMVFGLGSGLGFYYLKSDHISPSRQIMGRSAALETNAAEALGLELTEHRTGDPEEGWLGVREALVQGRPVIVQCDLSELPYWETETPFNGHRIVVAGFDEETDTVEVADTHFEGLQTIERATLQRARASEAPPSMDDDFAWWELAPDEP